MVTINDWELALKDDPLLTESFPFACMSIVVPRVDLNLETILDRYDLMTMPSKWAGISHFHAIERKEAEHKRQAVKLFVAAIEIILDGISDRLYLFEVSRLHELMASAIGIDTSPYTVDGKLAPLLNSAAAITLDEAVTLHLRQAGFPIPQSVVAARMSKSDVGALAQDLIHEANARRGAACIAR